MTKSKQPQTEYGCFEIALRQVLSAPKQEIKPKDQKQKSKKYKPKVIKFDYSSILLPYLED